MITVVLSELIMFITSRAKIIRRCIVIYISGKRAINTRREVFPTLTTVLIYFIFLWSDEKKDKKGFLQFEHVKEDCFKEFIDYYLYSFLLFIFSF